MALTSAERESQALSSRSERVVGLSEVLDVTLSLDTNAYSDGDVLADTQEIANAVRVPGGTAILQSVQVLDEDDQGCALTLVFSSGSGTLGTENAAPSISDANARNILGYVSVAALDYIDLGGSRIATIRGAGLVLKAAAGATSLYIAAITRGGTPTYTAAGIKLKLGLLQD